MKPDPSVKEVVLTSNLILADYATSFIISESIYRAYWRSSVPIYCNEPQIIIDTERCQEDVYVYDSCILYPEVIGEDQMK